MDFSTINWIAVPVAAVSAFALGGLWYGPLFGKSWQALMKLSDEDLQNSGHPAMIFGCAFLLTLVQATVLAALLPAAAGAGAGAGLGLLLGVAFVASAFGVNYLFARHPRALFGIDAGYNVVQFAIMGGIIGAFG